MSKRKTCSKGGGSENLGKNRVASLYNDPMKRKCQGAGWGGERKAVAN